MIIQILSMFNNNRKNNQPMFQGFGQPFNNIIAFRPLKNNVLMYNSIILTQLDKV
jgi:hypothetical protein